MLRVRGVCSVDGCGRPYFASGYCGVHYKREKKYGDPLAGRTLNGDSHKWILEHLDCDGDACLLWPFAKKRHGYGGISIDGKIEWTHVVMCTIAHGPKPTPKHEVRHLCGKGRLGCVNPIHLRWGTSKENKADSIKHGTSNRGMRNGRAKLKESDVLKIIERLASGEKQTDLAKEYGVAQPVISTINSGKRWSWLTGIQPSTSS